MVSLEPHIQLHQDLVKTDAAIIMGDPARVTRVATYLENVEALAYNREFKSLVGNYKGKRILALSTGVGAPSAGIAMEEMHHIGIKKVIRVGSCGAMQSHIGLGELIIAEGVVRDDGLSKKYVPAIYPAVPSFRLLQVAHRLAPKAFYGIIRSHDGFYVDGNEEVEDFWHDKGILGDDMESGIMMTIGRLRGMETLSILNNVVLYRADLAAGVNDLVHEGQAVATGEIESITLALDILSDASLEG